ncbi:MAG: hypothetical protein V4510_12750 [bacterium]
MSELKLGLRDYRWLNDVLPGRVAPMDLDFVLERKGHFLVQEYKSKGAPMPMGQRLTLKALVRLGMDVWLVWEDEQDPDRVEVGSMDRNGNVPFVESMRRGRLRRRVADWFMDASKED